MHLWSSSNSSSHFIPLFSKFQTRNKQKSKEREKEMACTYNHPSQEEENMLQFWHAKKISDQTPIQNHQFIVKSKRLTIHIITANKTNILLTCCCGYLGFNEVAFISKPFSNKWHAQIYCFFSKLFGCLSCIDVSNCIQHINTICCRKKGTYSSCLYYFNFYLYIC